MPCSAQFPQVLTERYKSPSYKGNVSRIHQISEWQEGGTERGVLFCLYIACPCSWWLLLIWHIQSILTRTNLCQLSSFYKHKNRPHCYDQLPQNTITSLSKLHPPPHCGGSPALLPQCAFWPKQHCQLCSYANPTPFPPLLQLEEPLLPFITGFLPHLRIPHCSLPHSFPLSSVKHNPL